MPSHSADVRVVLALGLVLGGCSLQTGALIDVRSDAAADSSRADEGTPPDATLDSSPTADTMPPTDTMPPLDATIDAPMDTTPTCVPADETCNAMDDDCDLEVDETGCDCDRETFDGHVYLFCTSGDTFAGAESACASWGYHLLFVQTSGEQDFAWSEASRRNVTDWWLGLSDRNVEGRYEWTDGTVVWEGGAAGYHAFRGGAPDDTSGENCFELDSGGGAWAGAGCDQSQPYVCESP